MKTAVIFRAGTFLLLNHFISWSRLHGAVDPRQWTFPVTPQGSPYRDVQLLENSDRVAFSKLSLRPMMVFDGEDCFSKIVIPELESWLIKKGEEHYEWRRMGGGTVVFSGERFKAFGSDWIAQRHFEQGAIVTILTNARGAESYEFNDCFLHGYTRGERTFTLTYDEDLLTRIEQTKPFAKTILLIDRSADGLEAAVRFQDRLLNLVYNERGQMMFCQDGATGMRLVEYEYSPKHLLRKIIMPAEILSYEWTFPKWTELYDTCPVLIPVVRSDGFFDYETKIDELKTSVDFRSHDGGIAGEWQFDPLKGELQCTFAKGDFRAVQSVFHRKID